MPRKRSKLGSAKPKVFKPVKAHDVTDEKLVAGNLRRVEREMHSGFALIAGELKAITQLLTATQDDHGVRIAATERNVADLQRARHDTDQRLAALEGARKE